MVPAAPPAPRAVELEEPPLSPDGRLVPGSPYPDSDWAMAAHRMAAGWAVVQVARAMGCHRSTIWRAYHAAPAFRARVEWERSCQQREALHRVRALGAMAVARIEMALAQGDLATARWVIDRIALGRLPVEERTAGLPPPPGPDVPDEAVGAPPPEHGSGLPLDRAPCPAASSPAAAAVGDPDGFDPTPLDPLDEWNPEMPLLR